MHDLHNGEFVREGSEGRQGLHAHQLNPLLLIVEQAQDPIADLVRVEIVDVLRFQQADDDDVEELLSDVPVRTVIHVRDHECDEVVLVLLAVSHHLEYPNHGPDGFLPDYVLAIPELLDKLRDLPAQACRAKHATAALFLLHVLKGEVEELVDNGQSCHDYLEVLILEELDKEVEQLLRLSQHYHRIQYYLVRDLLCDHIYGLSPHLPVVLRVHYHLISELLSHDQVLI
jgi:hypothetical protein